ncbi:MAG: type II toxin-antitoxin system RelE/ParE family toxin [Sedimenticola sp.]
MKVVQTGTFTKVAKKLHQNQKDTLDVAVKDILKNPKIGDMKVGDLAGARIYKFKLNTEQYLLGYRIDDDSLVLTLFALGTHENFYRDMKKIK